MLACMHEGVGVFKQAHAHSCASTKGMGVFRAHSDTCAKGLSRREVCTEGGERSVSTAWSDPGHVPGVGDPFSRGCDIQSTLP